MARPGRHEHALRLQPDTRIALPEELRRAPVGGGFALLQQPGFGQQQCPGTDRADDRAPSVLVQHKADRRIPASGGIEVAAQTEVADNDHI